MDSAPSDANHPSLITPSLNLTHHTQANQGVELGQHVGDDMQLRINGGSGDNAGLSSNGSPSHDPQSSNNDSSNGHSSFEPVDWFIFVVVNIGSSVNWILWKKDFYKTETEKLLGQMIAATWFCYAATFAVAYFLSDNRSHSGQNPHSRPNGP
ncbi:hypothetical protein D9756_009671 [Leucocoprinus leucothites]|uniref:Uncharacterized protein n=1 Tax=Leucocoprinus leucothites TaxID=201217 RepID=A0A8H5FTY7_9AGAR|nr:hypothetical protein D9756_009671 [Leucoagaricus leucothites]